MTVIESWCARCQKNVIADVEISLKGLSNKKWICPLCGGDLGSKNVGLPTAYIANIALPTGYEKYGD